MEIGICLAVTGILLFLYYVFGQILFFLTGGETDHALCLLTGVFVYHILFQAEALPLVFLLQPLKILSVLWMGTILLAVVLWIYLRHRHRKGILPRPQKPESSPWLLAVLVAAVGIQIYYIITNEYLGWDTSYYVGTIGTSVFRNSMYQFDSETGLRAETLDLRYALSSFYLHGAVWCQVLPVRAIYFAKVVQGGTLAVLSNLVIYEMGLFLFRAKRYRGRLTERQIRDGAAVMVIAAVFLNFFYKTIYTTSDFLLNRALEAKGYCANLILPLLFLLGLSLWKDSRDKTKKIMFFLTALGSVAVSMSALVIVPALITIVMIPVLFQERSWASVRFYILCMLPNTVYLVIYLLYLKGIFEIRI